MVLYIICEIFFNVGTGIRISFSEISRENADAGKKEGSFTSFDVKTISYNYTRLVVNVQGLLKQMDELATKFFTNFITWIYSIYFFLRSLYSMKREK